MKAIKLDEYHWLLCRDSCNRGFVNTEKEALIKITPDKIEQWLNEK